MSKFNKYISRRNFLKTAGVAGAASLISPLDPFTDPQANSASNKSRINVVPMRPFGRTKVNVPILCLGSAFGRSNNRFLKHALKMGVRLWDTAASYGGGISEKAIGKYFTKYPEDRKKVFLVTKSYSILPQKWSIDLKSSLKRMNTSYIDLFLIHAVSDFNIFSDPRVKTEVWGAKQKSEEKIKYFGFSTHQDMEKNLLKASKFAWVDGIMFSYNYRIMHSEKMTKAVDACTNAGIGLIAMKTQASGYLGHTEKITPNEKEQVFFDMNINRLMREAAIELI